MRKVFVLLGCLLFLLWGCAPAEAEVADDQALLTVNGEVIFTGKDLANYMTEQRIQKEVRGKEEDSQKEVFEKMAEKRLLAHIAAELGINEDPSFLEEQYDLHMDEIQDTDVYGDELEFSQKLQEALGMDDEAFRQWNIAENIIDYDVDNLISDVTESFNQIQNAEDMEQVVAENLRVFLEMYDIECTYPGLENWMPTFEYTVLS